MDRKWFEQQTKEIGSALAKQGIRLVVPTKESFSEKDLSQPSSAGQLAPYIDHTLLKPTASLEQIRQLCNEAKVSGFASVCVNPVHVSRAWSLLKNSSVKVCTVIGFPLGATSTLSKVMETRDAVANGADEIDMVVNIGSLLEKDYATVYSDIKAVRDAALHQVLKVILETGYLSKEQIVRGCILSKMAGADFVKTSTGFGPGGATVEDISLMRKVVGPDFGVKASGGIRDFPTALAMIEAGATRLGASSGVQIIEGLRGETEY